MSHHDNNYHLGTSDEELDRLAYQHQVWSDVTTSLWDRASFDSGSNLLDLGCGPGFATFDLAERVGPFGVVHALDNSPKFLEFLVAQCRALGHKGIKTHQGDVHDIDLDDDSLDGTFARWLMCFVRDPQQVIAEVFRVLRPGGRFAVIDYFNYQSVGVFPVHPALEALFRGYYQSAIVNGGSYDIGNHIPEMLVAEGFELTSLAPICRIAQPGSPLWKWVELFHDSYLPKLDEQGLLGEVTQAEIRQAWEEVSRNPAGFFYPPPLLAVVARKPN